MILQLEGKLHHFRVKRLFFFSWWKNEWYIQVPDYSSQTQSPDYQLFHRQIHERTKKMNIHLVITCLANLHTIKPNPASSQSTSVRTHLAKLQCGSEARFL